MKYNTVRLVYEIPTHLDFIDGFHVSKPTYKKLEKSAILPYASIAYSIHNPENPIAYIGYTLRSPEDEWSRAKGRTTALQRHDQIAVNPQLQTRFQFSYSVKDAMTTSSRLREIRMFFNPLALSDILPVSFTLLDKIAVEQAERHFHSWR